MKVYLFFWNIFFRVTYVTIAEQRQQNFGMVQRAFIRVVDQDTQQEIVRFDLTEEVFSFLYPRFRLASVRFRRFSTSALQGLDFCMSLSRVFADLFFAHCAVHVHLSLSTISLFALSPFFTISLFALCNLFRSSQFISVFVICHFAAILQCSNSLFAIPRRNFALRFTNSLQACMWSCMLFGELYRYGNEWKFKALGQGMQGGLKGVGAQFGMQLA